MTLSTTGTVVMVVIIAAAVVAMITVLASANRRNARAQEPNHEEREERPELRYPGLNPDAARRHADLAGDDATASVEPGGHVVRPAD